MKKYLIPLMLVVVFALSACGGCEDTATVDYTPPVVSTPVVAQTPAAEPIVTDATPVEACPQSFVGCSPSPYPYTPRPVGTITPDPAPVCVRDTTPLVFVDPFWVDNCGNKYGQVTV